MDLAPYALNVEIAHAASPQSGLSGAEKN